MAVAPKADLYARAVADRDEIAAFLRTDRRYAAYALGDLDGPNRARCRWGLAYDDLGRPTRLAMHQDGLIPQPLFVMGDPAGVVEVLSSVIRPRDAYLLGPSARRGGGRPVPAGAAASPCTAWWSTAAASSPSTEGPCG